MSELGNIWRLFKAKIKQSKQYYLIASTSLVFTVTVMISAFSVVDAVYLNSVPYAKPSHLYWLEHTLDINGTKMAGSNTQIFQHSQKNHKEDIATYFSWSDYSLVQITKKTEIPVVMATVNLFDILQVQPEKGRFFDEREKMGNKQPSAILSYKAWEQHFSKDDNIIGKQIQLNSRQFQVIGVAPNGMTLPNRDDINEAIWLPVDMDEVLTPSDFRGFGGGIKGLVRLDSTTPQHVETFNKKFIETTEEGAELYAPEVVQEYEVSARVTPLDEAILGESQRVILSVVIGALLIAGIATINIASMHLARAVKQAKTVAISLAFGATKKQIFKEAFVQNFMLTGVSALVGLVFTQLSFSVIYQAANEVIPRLDALSLSMNLIVFSLFLSALLALLLSWVELKAVKETQLLQHLQSSGKGQGKQIKQSTTHVLIGFQLGFSILVLTASAHLLSNTLSELLSPTHLRMDNLYNLNVNYGQVKDREERINIHKALMSALPSTQGVEALSFSNEKRVPSANNIDRIYDEKGRALDSIRYSLVDEKYMDMLSMVVEGRGFTADDASNPNFPVIINQRLADKLVGNPIGQVLARTNKKPMKVIGVVSNTDYPGGDYLEVGEAFTMQPYDGRRWHAITVRYSESISVTQLKRQLRRAIADIDPRLLIQQQNTVQGDFDEQVKQFKFGAIFAFVLGFMSLLMVMAGIAGMVHYTTQMHRYSLGVKMAMGAKRKVLLVEEVANLEKPIIATAFFVFSLIVFLIGYLRTRPEWAIEPEWGLVFSVILGILILATLSCWAPVRSVLNKDPIKALRNE